MPLGFVLIPPVPNLTLPGQNRSKAPQLALPVFAPLSGVTLNLLMSNPTRLRMHLVWTLTLSVGSMIVKGPVIGHSVTRCL